MEKTGIDFGGEAKPNTLHMIGSCSSTGPGAVQACVWKAEENTKDVPVPKYIINF